MKYADSDNIQMLTCFTLPNVVKGLMILAAEVFGLTIDMKTLIVTLKEEGTRVEESQGFTLHASRLKELSDN